MRKKVRVNTAVKDIFLETDSSQTGSEFLSQVEALAGVVESGWLGLQYQDLAGSWLWLHDKKKVLSQDLNMKEEPIVMFLKVRIFPERPSTLYDPVVQNLVFLQVKMGIEAGDLICPLDAERRLDMFKHENKVEQYLMEAEALMEYGWWHFLMLRPHDSSPMRVSISTKGIAVAADNRLHRFSFSEVQDVAAKGKKLILKHVSKAFPPFIFLGPNAKFIQDLHYLISLHHQFYLRNN